MDSAEYEQLVGKIVRGLAERAGVAPESIQGGRTNRVEGVSGYRHQIDVSIRDGEDLHLIECKRWAYAVEARDVLTLLGRIVDIRQKTEGKLSASIITTAKYQSGAKQLADHFGISLDVVKTAGEFVVRYRDRVGAGLQDVFVFGDFPESRVIKADGSPD